MQAFSMHGPELTEDEIKCASREQALAERRRIQAILQEYLQTNPGILSRKLSLINERLFEINYYKDDSPEY